MAKANTTVLVVAILDTGETRTTKFDADIGAARRHYDYEADGEDVLVAVLLRPAPKGYFEIARTTSR